MKDFLSNRPELKQRQVVVGHVTGQTSTQDFRLSAAQQAAVFREFRQGNFRGLVDHISFTSVVIQAQKISSLLLVSERKSIDQID